MKYGDVITFTRYDLSVNALVVSHDQNTDEVALVYLDPALDKGTLTQAAPKVLYGVKKLDGKAQVGWQEAGLAKVLNPAHGFAGVAKKFEENFLRPPAKVSAPQVEAISPAKPSAQDLDANAAEQSAKAATEEPPTADLEAVSE